MVGRVGLVNARQGHSSGLQTLRQQGERKLVTGRQNDGVRALWVPLLETLTRRVDYLRGLQPFGEIRTHNDVVRQGIETFNRRMAMAC